MIRGLFRKRALRRTKLLHNDIGNARHVVDRALLRLATGHATFIVTLNPEIMEECVRDATYHDVLDRADIITCDGVGVTLAAAVQGYGLPRRVTGVQISRAFLEYSARSGVPVMVVGATPESRTEFERRARSLGANIQTGLSPAVGVELDAQAIARQLPARAVVLVALGAPRQEFLIDAIRCLDSELRIYVGVGGAVDYLSGAVRLPPRIVSRIGLEWFYRLVTQPRKRFGRHARSLPSFLWFEILVPLLLRPFGGS